MAQNMCTLDDFHQALTAPQAQWKSSKVLDIVTMVTHTQVQVYNAQAYPHSVSVTTCSYYAASIQK